jgi:hypothetical protein
MEREGIMRVRLFGKNSDDKGTQLEKLTRRLLERLGYRQITLNFVGSGGSEIDIRAEYPVPGLGSESIVHLIGECKAYEATVGLPDWLKFLGKVFTEKACKHRDIRGLFIALSGENGNVAGAYEELRTHDESVELISGDRLAAQILDEFKLPEVSRFLLRIGQLTRDAVAAVSLGYYEGRAFWIAEFANSTFTVLYGEALDQSPSEELAEIVSGQIQAAKYRDLSQEQLSKDRLALARKYVLGQLMTKQTTDLPAQENFFPPGLRVLRADVEEARTALQAEGKLTQEGAALKLGDIEGDLSLRAAVIREALSGICILSYLAMPEWEALIDDKLLDESLRVKDGLVIEEADRPPIVQLMKWSPTALLWALNPDEVLCGHRGKVPQVDEMMVPNHARYYRIQMLNLAINDFRGPSFGTMLYERYGLRELELTHRGAFKSQKGVDLEMKVTERIAIARYDPSLGGGLGHVWLLENAPEPWSIPTPERTQPNAEKGSDKDSTPAPAAPRRPGPSNSPRPPVTRRP